MINNRTDRLILKIPCKETHSKIARLVISGLATELQFSISEVAYLRSRLSGELVSCINQLRQANFESHWITLSIIVSKKSLYFELSDEQGRVRGSKHYRRGTRKTFLDTFAERVNLAANSPVFKQTYGHDVGQVNDIITYLE